MSSSVISSSSLTFFLAIRDPANKQQQLCLKAHKFPKDNDEAVKLVLWTDINEELTPKALVVFTDTLEEEVKMTSSFYEPYRRVGTNRYARRNAYMRFSAESLDPFVRFKFEQLTPRELFYRRWFLSTPETSLGHFFEALLACHAIQYEACYRCKYHKSLRWMGGPGASWQDLVCIVCESMFEIKTKASMEKVEKCFAYNRTSGGSFRRYCALRNGLNENTKKQQTMFLVLVPRLANEGVRSGRYHPTYISEMDIVFPRLVPRSFDRGSNKEEPIELKSLVSVKRKFVKWFDLPASAQSYDSMAFINVLKIELYVLKFSQQDYDQFEAEASSCGEEQSRRKIVANGKQSSTKESQSQLDLLMAQFQDMQVKNQDRAWDESSD